MKYSDITAKRGMRFGLKLAAAGAGAFFISACEPTPDDPIEPTLASIQQYVFDDSCDGGSCHSAGSIHDWDLSNEQASFNTLVYQQSNVEPSYNRVEPGDPDNSLLIQKLENTAITDRMPLIGRSVPQYKIDAIRQWIADLPTSPQPTLRYLQKNVFTPDCATSGCHDSITARQGLDLSDGSTLASLLSVPSGQSALNLIEPGDPDASWLVSKLESGSMPSNGGALSPEKIAAVRGWIESLTGPEPTTAWIQDNILTPTCAYTGCHDDANPDAGLSLVSGVSLDNMLSIPSGQRSQYNLIEPGDPDNSYLVRKLENANDILLFSMPWLLPKLPAEQLTVVRQWISDMDAVVDPDPDPDPDPVAEPTLEWIQANIFNTCTGCHGTQGGLALNEGVALANLVNVPSTVDGGSSYRVLPGDAENSMLYRKLLWTAPGMNMPVGGAQLSADKLNAVRDWINTM